MGDEMDPMAVNDEEETEEEELAGAGMHVDGESEVVPPEEDMMTE